jgi:hypothetical protein
MRTGKLRPLEYYLCHPTLAAALPLRVRAQERTHALQQATGAVARLTIAVGTLIAERPPQSGRVEARTGLR